MHVIAHLTTSHRVKMAYNLHIESGGLVGSLNLTINQSSFNKSFSLSDKNIVSIRADFSHCGLKCLYKSGNNFSHTIHLVTELVTWSKVWVRGWLYPQVIFELHSKHEFWKNNCDMIIRNLSGTILRITTRVTYLLILLFIFRRIDLLKFVTFFQKPWTDSVRLFAVKIHMRSILDKTFWTECLVSPENWDYFCQVNLQWTEWLLQKLFWRFLWICDAPKNI